MTKAEFIKRLKRKQIKTTEGEFIYELRNSFELSPKISGAIFYSASKHLLGNKILSEGRIEITVISIEEKAGKIVEEMKRRRVIITVDCGPEDDKILKEFGRIALRQVRIQRITDEAIEQDGIMSQEDIARALSCDTRTIQRDIRELKEREIEVQTRGVLHNIGRGQTHKVKIIGMYLDGKTYSEIRLKMHHSIGAIKRYMESFTKVLAAIKFDIRGKKYISSVTGLSENLVMQYMELINESEKDEMRKEKMEEMVNSWIRNEDLKKRMLRSGYRAVITEGGVI